MQQVADYLTAETKEIFDYIKGFEDSLSTTMSKILNRECTVLVQLTGAGSDEGAISVDVDLRTPEQTERTWTECHCDAGIMQIPQEDVCIRLANSLLTTFGMYCMAGLYSEEALERVMQGGSTE